MADIVTLAHGNGGKLMHDLIRDVFKKHLSNEILDIGDDCAQFIAPPGRLAFTTDSYVVSPLFFKGGNIGKLAVCGTVNDLASAGAKPLYMSCGFIIEEGFPISKLEEIIRSMAETAHECGMIPVTGDTKVVEKGSGDGVFINTSGIGLIPKGIVISGRYAKPGDKVIVTGTLGDHGCAIMLERENLGINSNIISDCAPLGDLVEKLLSEVEDVHVLRDPTRGGLSTTLNEIAAQSGVGIKLQEDRIPVNTEVRGVCELLGLDHLYLANEGKMIVIVGSENADRALSVLKSHKYGTQARIIGEVLDKPAGKVFIQTITGGYRILDVLVGDQLPRIC